MNDEGFLEALERCELPAQEFGHAAHVRAAYLYLTRAAPDQALEHIRRSLRRFVAHLGRPDVYDDAMTAAYMKVIRERLAERGDAGGWAAFARNNPDLFSIRL
jgi:hypothetical protein